MAAEYAPIFASVLVEENVNDTIVFHDGVDDRTATLAPGTYYLRGDGAADDLAAAVLTALDAAPSSAVGFLLTLVSHQTNAAFGACGVAIADDAGAAWTLKTTGTFDLALLGFTTSQAAADGIVTSDASASCVWVPTQPFARFRPRYPSRTKQTVSRSGIPRSMRLAAQREERVLSVQHVDGRRVHASENSTDEAAAFSSFLDLVRDGRKVELRAYELASGESTLDLAFVRWLGVYHLGPALLDGTWEPRRGTGPSRWSWDVELRRNPSEDGPAAPTLSYVDQEVSVDDVANLTPTTGGAISRYSYTGTLPGGISFSTSTGAFTGTYTTEQEVSVVVTAHGPTGTASDTVTFTVAAGAAIDPPPGAASLDYDFGDIDGDDSLNAAYADLDPIPTIVDKGALGVDAVQAVSTAQPTLRIGGGFGGGDYGSFDGGDWLSTGAAAFAALAQPNTVAVIGNVAVAGIEVFVDGDAVGRRQQVYASSGPSFWTTAGTALNSGIAPTADQWESLVAVFDSTTLSRLTVSGVDGTGGGAGAHTPQGLVIGSRYDGGASWLTGGIQHVLVYDDATNAAPPDIKSYWETRHSAVFPAAGAP